MWGIAASIFLFPVPAVRHIGSTKVATIQQAFGEAIKATRVKQHLTQDELGALVGVQKAQISKIESGKSITYATIVKVFKALGATTASMDLGHLGRVVLW